LVQPAAILWLLSDGEFDPMRHAKRAWPCFADMIRSKPVIFKKPGIHPNQKSPIKE
jgi:hypothetical protein